MIPATAAAVRSIKSAMESNINKGIKCVPRFKNKILLVQHAKGIRNWSFPGGKIELGESPEQCVHREMKEELGVNLKNLNRFGQTKSKIDNKIIYCYECDLLDEEINIKEDEILKASWFLKDALPQDMGPTSQEVLKLWSAK